MCGCITDCVLVIISVLFPPLPVWIRRGICSCDSLINIMLCFLGYLPGLIHSWYIIAKYPPYNSYGDTKIYYVYRNDIENQTPHRTEHHFHHHNTITPHDQTPIRAEPRGYNATYGSIPVQEGTSTEPPQYSEFDNKTQK